MRSWLVFDFFIELYDSIRFALFNSLQFVAKWTENRNEGVRKKQFNWLSKCEVNLEVQDSSALNPKKKQP